MNLPGSNGKVSFETIDLAGNPVTSEELFADHKVTMVNLWATWCVPCKKELPELQPMSEAFEARGCQLVGICLDASEEGKTEEALSILQDAGVKYLNLVGTDEIREQMNSLGIPVSFFLDSEGNILTEPVEGPGNRRLITSHRSDPVVFCGRRLRAMEIMRTKKSSRRGWIFYVLVWHPPGRRKGRDLKITPRWRQSRSRCRKPSRSHSDPL